MTSLLVCGVFASPEWVEGRLEMAPTESTQSNTASGTEAQPRSQTEIERVAQFLGQRGFDTSLQTRGVRTDSDSGSHSSVEVEVERDDRAELEEALNDANTTASYRVIWPEETSALRGWPSAPGESNQSSRTAIVTSAPASQVGASEKAQRRASFL